MQSAAIVGMIALTMIDAPARIEVQGHRGARAVHPENTLAAFEYAVADGVDVLELDCQVTKDDRLIVAHDPLINPQLCLGPDGKAVTGEIPIRSLTLAEAQRYDCGSLPHPRFPQQAKSPGAKMPSLEEVFRLVERMKHPHAKKVRFNIELKSVPAKPEWSAPAEQYAKLLVLELKTAKLEHRVTVQSFDHRLLREVKRIAPQLPVAALTGEVYPNYVALMEELGAEILSPNMAWIDRDAVSALHAANKRVIPWTANSAAEWDALIAMGVDGIITDDPHALMLHLQKRGKRPYP